MHLLKLARKVSLVGCAHFWGNVEPCKDMSSGYLLCLALQILACILCSGVGLVAQILRLLLCLLRHVLSHGLCLVSNLLRLALYVVGHLLCMLGRLCMSIRVLSLLAHTQT